MVARSGDVASTQTCFSLPNETVTGLAFDQDRTLYVATSIDNGGLRVANLYAIGLASSGLPMPGRMPIRIAGTGNSKPVPLVFEVPQQQATPALLQDLAGDGNCNLAIDLRDAASTSVSSGHLYFGNVIGGGMSGSAWSQVVKILPKVGP
jgi:hypothetical protein